VREIILGRVAPYLNLNAFEWRFNDYLSPDGATGHCKLEYSTEW